MDLKSTVLKVRLPDWRRLLIFVDRRVALVKFWFALLVTRPWRFKLNHGWSVLILLAIWVSFRRPRSDPLRLRAIGHSSHHVAFPTPVNG